MTVDTLPQSPFVDPATGQLSLEWYFWLRNTTQTLTSLIAATSGGTGVGSGVHGRDGMDGEDGAIGPPGVAGRTGAQGPAIPGPAGDDAEWTSMPMPVKAPDSYQLQGGSWERPGTIGSGAPNTGAFTDVTVDSLTAGTSGTTGLIGIKGGTPGASGYAQFIATNGNRQGYIGYSITSSATDTGTLQYVAGLHQFSGAVSTTGAATLASLAVTGTLKGSTGNYQSGDGTTAISTTITTALLVGKTITVKDGLITGFA